MSRLLNFSVVLAFSFMATMAHGASETSVLSTGPADCAVNETWDGPMGMCMPSANSGVPMAMLIVNGNAFAVYITEQGPRGRNTFAGPNMFMVDLGKTFGERHYLNLDYMGTVGLFHPTALRNFFRSERISLTGNLFWTLNIPIALPSWVSL